MQETIDFEGKQVKIYGKDSWEYASANNVAIKVINPELHERINIAVADFIKNIDEIKKKEYEDRKKKEQEENDRLMDLFISDIARDYGTILAGYNVEFGKVFEYRSLSIRKPDTGLGYNPRLSISYDKYSERHWRVETSNITTRFSHLDKAIKKGLEHLEECIKEKINEAQAEQRLVDEENAMIAFATAWGYKFVKDYQSSYDRRRHWYNFYIKNGIVKARIVYDREDKRIKIIDVMFDTAGTNIILDIDTIAKMKAQIKEEEKKE